jgi:hypothetical protein
MASHKIKVNKLKAKPEDIKLDFKDCIKKLVQEGKN